MCWAFLPRTKPMDNDHSGGGILCHHRSLQHELRFCLSYIRQLGYRILGENRDQHVNMAAYQVPLQQSALFLNGQLPENLPQVFPKFPLYYFLPIFRDPNYDDTCNPMSCDLPSRYSSLKASFLVSSEQFICGRLPHIPEIVKLLGVSPVKPGVYTD